MSTFRVGIIGAGGIAAKLHLPELQGVEDAEVVVLAGRKPARLETLCQKFHVPRWTQSYDEVIGDPNLDGVVIALPHPLHVEFGLLALAANKHVLMQKPLSTSLTEAEQYVQAVEQSDRTVLALPFVSKPHVLTAREWVATGRLGTVSSATARFSHGGPEVYYATIQSILNEQPDDDLWFFDAQRADVGALFDMGVYAIAHLVAILGSVQSVTCCTATRAKPTTLEDTATLILEFESGVLGTAETGWCDGARTYGFAVHGTAGKLTNPSLSSDLVYSRPSSFTDEDAPLIEESVETTHLLHRTAHQEWIDCCRNGIQPEISNIHFARHVTEVMLKGLQSSQQRRTLEVESRL